MVTGILQRRHVTKEEKCCNISLYKNIHLLPMFINLSYTATKKSYEKVTVCIAIS